MSMTSCSMGQRPSTTMALCRSCNMHIIAWPLLTKAVVAIYKYYARFIGSNFSLSIFETIF
jgi:hypothetical protein